MSEIKELALRIEKFDNELGIDLDAAMHKLTQEL
jgi:hypothetical protein